MAALVTGLVLLFAIWVFAEFSDRDKKNSGRAAGHRR